MTDSFKRREILVQFSIFDLSIDRIRKPGLIYENNVDATRVTAATHGPG